MLKPLTSSADIGSAFNKAMELYKENFVLVFCGSLVVGLISQFTFGICAGPMLCGFYGVLLALLRKQEPKPQFGDIFNGFQKFVPSFVSLLVHGIIMGIATMILCIIPILGWLALIPFSIIYPIVIVWAVFLVQDQNATIGEAIVEPIKLLKEKKFWSVILVCFVACLIGAAGTIVCGIGALFTAPFAACMIAAAYEQAYSGAAPEEAPADAAPAAAPTDAASGTPE